MGTFNDKKYKNSPEEIDRKMSQKAQKAVKEQLEDTIILSQKDILHIAVALKRTDVSTFKDYIPSIRNSWNKAKKDHLGFAQVKLLDHTKKVFVDALANSSDTREMFDTLKDMMKWYGIVREKTVRFNTNYIPEDTRTGIYENDQYDGTQWYEFVDNTFDNPEESLEKQEENWKKEEMEYSRG